MTDTIFISYGHEDEEFVLRLARDLEARAARVWIDRGDLHPGMEWQRAIADSIAGCQAFLLVVSKDSLESAYVNQELTLAEAHQKPIFPLIYEETRLPEHLQERQFIDFRRGGYASNLADLITGLVNAGVSLSQAPELSPEARAARRQERLGAAVRVRWGQVLRRIPGWSLAWGLGWAIFWLVIPVAMSLFGDSESGNLLLYPLGGLLGGLGGGVFAGTITMLVLRHHAISIGWKHMRSSISIWGLVGPLGALAAAGLALLFFEAVSTQVDCAGMSIGDCFGAKLGQGIADALANAIGMIISIIFYASVALFVIGLIAGWLAVRHIRRLEPGILGRQAIWVILSWGAGAFVAGLFSLMFIGLLEG